MTIQTAEDQVISGINMTITALIPFTGVITAENGKTTVMFSELCRLPSIKTVADFAIFTET
jgi:hypothetical protein